MTSEERAAHNQATFRAANEGIDRKALDRGDLLTFLCECGDGSCRDTIQLSHEEYEGVRRDARSFALAHGHEGPGDAIVEEFERFTLIEKTGVAGQVVDERNPRNP